MRIVSDRMAAVDSLGAATGVAGALIIYRSNSRSSRINRSISGISIRNTLKYWNSFLSLTMFKKVLLEVTKEGYGRVCFWMFLVVPPAASLLLLFLVVC